MAEPLHDPWAYNTVCQFSLYQTYAGQRMVNVFAFEATPSKESGLGGNQNKIDWCSDVIDAWILRCRDSFLLLHPPSWHFDTIRCQVVEIKGQKSGRLSPVESNINLPGTHTPIAQDASITTSMNLKWHTDIAKASHRGRTYIGGVSSDHVNSTSPTANGITVLNNFASALLLGFGGAVVTPDAGAWLTIYSRPYDYSAWTYRANGKLLVHEVGPYAGNSTHVLNHSVDPRTRVQRRREVGVGA